jgi:hypothetical protein
LQSARTMRNTLQMLSIFVTHRRAPMPCVRGYLLPTITNYTNILSDRLRKCGLIFVPCHRFGFDRFPLWFVTSVFPNKLSLILWNCYYQNIRNNVTASKASVVQGITMRGQLSDAFLIKSTRPLRNVIY